MSASTPNTSPSHSALTPTHRWVSPAATPIENVDPPPYVNPMNGFSWTSAAPLAESTKTKAAVQEQTRTQARNDRYRAKIPRKTLAKGDTVTSPELSANGFTSPSLFATTISVIPRDGTVTTIDDEAFSLIPNCHTTVF